MNCRPDPPVRQEAWNEILLLNTHLLNVHRRVEMINNQTAQLIEVATNEVLYTTEDCIFMKESLYIWMQSNQSSYEQVLYSSILHIQSNISIEETIYLQIG